MPAASSSLDLARTARAYVLADRTIRGRQPTVWARAAVAAFSDYAADRIVAEVNQGGDLVLSVIRQVDPNVPVRSVRATRGKWVRAEPVSALYSEGRVSHVGEWPELEAQMCAFGPDGLANGKSPDRLDALVWALTDLMLTPKGMPNVRGL
jgi:phage terminase large subunit-like protein